MFSLIVRPVYAQAKPKARFKHGTYGTQGRAIFLSNREALLLSLHLGDNISGTQYITNDALSLKYQECICSNSQAYSCPSKARGQNRYRAESGKLDHARFVIFPCLSPQHHTVYCVCSYCLVCSKFWGSITYMY